MSACKLRGLKHLRQDVRGATLVEFAIVAMPLIVMMMAMFDLGFREYISIQLAGALDQSARQVTVGTATTVATVKASVTAQIRTILPGATVTVGALLKRVIMTSIGGMLMSLPGSLIGTWNSWPGKGSGGGANFNGSGLVPELGSDGVEPPPPLLRGLALGT